MEKVTVAIPKPDLEELEEFAKQDGENRCDLIRSAIYQYLCARKAHEDSARPQERTLSGRAQRFRDGLDRFHGKRTGTTRAERFEQGHKRWMRGG